MWRHLEPEEITKIKNENLDLYNEIEILVNEWDPIGFIAGGAPSDEYDCISVHLILLLKANKSTQEIYEFIVNELDNHFGMGIKSIKPEYLDNFINKHSKFSEKLKIWFKENCVRFS
jgi:hypothetical protein